jgi:periplasmic mercuric ion binding protein
MKLLIPAALMMISSAAFAEMATTKVNVSGLTCPSCSYIVATTLKRIETVEITDFTEGSNDDGTFVLQFNDAVTSAQAIVYAVTSVGYGAALVTGGGS